MSIGWIVVILVVALVVYATSKAWKRGGRESFRAGLNQQAQSLTALRARKAVLRLEEHQNDGDFLRQVTLESLHKTGFLPGITTEELISPHYENVLAKMRNLAG